MNQQGLLSLSLCDVNLLGGNDLLCLVTCFATIRRMFDIELFYYCLSTLYDFVLLHNHLEKVGKLGDMLDSSFEILSILKFGQQATSPNPPIRALS